ncbi:MAG: hypothetical protein MRK02_06915 [Candidatus Scalindua sp.]|nr:hypothetical protein [Candidatus Scalindua sp.]
MQDTFFVIGYILATILIISIAYRVKVWGFKFCFHELTHDITEVVGREKGIWNKINPYCLIVSWLLAPIILYAYPSFVEQFPDVFETANHFLLHAIVVIIYIAAMLGGFHHLGYIIRDIWQFRKEQKKIK